MKVIAINGSARRDGNTAILIGHLFSELEKEGIETELVQLSGQVIRGCTACNRCGTALNGHCAIDNDIVNEIIDKFAEADGIILGSPTYFADITSELKALIDRAGRVGRVNGGLYRRKVGAGVIAVRRGGAIHALDTIHHFLHIAEMVVPGSCYWNVGIGREIGEVEQDEEGLRTMRVLGENVAWLLKLTGAKQTQSRLTTAAGAPHPRLPGGGIHHIAVRTTDLNASLKLYRDLLGMRIVKEKELPGKRLVLLDTGDGSHIELLAPNESAPAGNSPDELHPLQHIALTTTDVTGVIGRVRTAGYEITVEPKEVNFGASSATVAFFVGPGGELIELYQ